MDKFDRIFRLHHFLKDRRRPVPLDAICEELECSERTSRRIIALLRDSLGAPVEYLREQNGYLYSNEGEGVYELPGMWFAPDELYALLVSYKLLADLHPGLLAGQISPVKHRIEHLLARQNLDITGLDDRIRIFQVAARPTNLKYFRMVTTALLQGRRLRTLYHGRSNDQTTERTLSPQRLIYYRSNWYLDAWCHLRDELRSFSLDRLCPVEIGDEAAKAIESEVLDHHFKPAYGIFSGKPGNTAVLRFTPEAAKWVADEEWHPQQQGKVLSDGGYELQVPYSDDRELVMDILKYGPDVQVLAPDTLKNKVIQRIRQAAEQY